jgi:hypothetical protein
VHVKNTFAEIEHMFPAHSHSFVDSYRDFRIMEKEEITRCFHCRRLVQAVENGKQEESFHIHGDES